MLAHRSLALLTLPILLAISGCDRPPSNDGTENTARVQFGRDSSAETEIAARVNDETITEAMVDAYIAERTSDDSGDSPARRAVLNELIAQTLLAQQARERGLQKRPELAARLVNARRSLLAQAAAEAYGEANPISEEELRETYDTGIARLDTRQYKARHILVEERPAAQTIIDELEAGGDLATLARERSTGPTADKGGDLGWFSPQQMVPPFRAALKELEPGEYTREPVQTRFGWHVILLEDTRQGRKPAFGDLKQSIRDAMRNAQVQNHLQTLRKQADIQISPDYAPTPDDSSKLDDSSAANNGQSAPE